MVKTILNSYVQLLSNAASFTRGIQVTVSSKRMQMLACEQHLSCVTGCLHVT